MTVVEVGEAWRDRFRPGQRFALQADFYYRGRNLAYGYVFTGGLAQYSLLGRGRAGRRRGVLRDPGARRPGLRRSRADRAVGVRRGGLRAAAAAARQGGRRAVDHRPARAGGRVPAGRDPHRHGRRARSSRPMCPRRCSTRSPGRSRCVRDGLTPADYAEPGPGGNGRRLRRHHRARPDRRGARWAARGDRDRRRWSTWSASGRWAGPCRWTSAASTTTMSSTWARAAPTSARRMARRATGRSCGRAASRGSSAAAGRWAGCTCSACWRWPTARARSSSPNPTWCATRSWSPPLRRWRAPGGSSSSCSTPSRWRPRITQRRCTRRTAATGSTTSW